MPTRSQILTTLEQYLEQWVVIPDDAWLAIYRLLLDYEHGVPRITDSNRLVKGAWRARAKMVESALAKSLGIAEDRVQEQVDVLMKKTYASGTQRMNPIGIALACCIVHLSKKFGASRFEWQMEAKIGTDIFPGLTGFRRQSVDIAAFENSQLYAAISSKWGVRHDRIRDPQEEADTYKEQEPSIKFVVVTNEFDSARLSKLIRYPAIDGVYHLRRELVSAAYKDQSEALTGLKDLKELFSLFR
jgi:hypothetical protein